VDEWEVDKILHITNQDFDEDLKNVHENPKFVTYKHNVKDPYLASIMEIVIIQLLFYKIAERKGIDPGVFRFSQKVTTDL